MKSSAKTEENNIAKQKKHNKVCQIFQNRENTQKPEVKNMKKTRALSVAETTDIVRDAANDPAKMNALIGATINIIGTDFVVEFIKKSDGGYTLLLIPTKVEEGQAQKRTLQEMIDAVNQLLGNGTKVDTKELESALEGTKFDKVTISLAMAFLYINQDAGKTEKELEYAFQVKCDGLSNLIPDGLRTFVDIKGIQLAIWNTNRTKVIETMGLIKPEDYLKDL